MKLSRNEIIHIALDEYIVRNQADAYAAFGLWEKDPIDGLFYQTRIRKSWLSKS